MALPPEEANKRQKAIIDLLAGEVHPHLYRWYVRKCLNMQNRAIPPTPHAKVWRKTAGDVVVTRWPYGVAHMFDDEQKTS